MPAPNQPRPYHNIHKTMTTVEAAITQTLYVPTGCLISLRYRMAIYLRRWTGIYKWFSARLYRNSVQWSDLEKTVSFRAASRIYEGISSLLRKHHERARLVFPKLENTCRPHASHQHTTREVAKSCERKTYWDSVHNDVPDMKPIALSLLEKLQRAPESDNIAFSRIGIIQREWV